MRPTNHHAVVLGASMAGLAAARVLADAYQRVTVLDRDTFPVAGGHRRGVPQSRHAHALLASGRAALEELFGGLTDELVAAGAPVGDLQADIRMYNEGLRLRQAPAGLTVLVVSRPLLEDRIRDRVRALGNVRLVDGCTVTGLAATPDGHGVGGVRVLRGDGPGEELVRADLVVDATGRGSRSPAWLEELGYRRPVEEQVRVGIAYTTRVYRRRPDHLGGDLAAVVAATPKLRRGGVIHAMEGDRWIVTLLGYQGEQPPVDREGFTAFAATLAAPDIFEVIRDAEPLEDARVARYPANVRRRYERLDRFPDGFLVVGDAVCGFNPSYAQGMSVAAGEALALRDCLRDGPADLGSRFRARTAAIVDIPWQIAVGSDLRLPEVEGPRSAKVRLVNAYLARLHVAAATDPEVGRAFLRVVNLLDRPERLLRPGIALRVLRGQRRRPLPDPGPGRAGAGQSSRHGATDLAWGAPAAARRPAGGRPAAVLRRAGRGAGPVRLGPRR
jgi:2-polyprenyl-6-methoxyphenol hydroxylase-like FAD-dependent oxidoreductase